MMKINVKITRQENATYFGCAIDDIVEVEFEEYVAAVVASELASGNLEACKAQAVASRSFAVSRGVLEGKPISDASSTAQAYRAKRYDNKSYPRCIEATNLTKGQVLMYGAHAASTVFSASNGGRTVSSKEKWGGARAYLPAQDDPWDAAAGTGKSGHGVGMSQRGCKYAAANGIPYTMILEFYYPNTTLVDNYGYGNEVKVMNDKANTVVETAKSYMGYPYVFGAWGEACTPSNRSRRASSSHPTIVSKCQVLSGKAANCEGCKWKGAKIFDCRGFTYACLLEVGIKLQGGGATSQYNYAKNWSERGLIKDMPNVVCCVFQKNNDTGKMAHTGLHIGDGKIIHCAVNVQNGDISNKAWTHYAIPNGLYDEQEINNAGEVKVMKKLKKGSRGEEVQQLQTILNALGYDCGLADGAFGDKTKAAVEMFQANEELVVDGIVGTNTWTILLGKIQNNNEPVEVPPVVDDDEDNDGVDYDKLMNEVSEIKALFDELGARLANIEAQLKK